MGDVKLPFWSRGAPGAGFRARSVRDDGVVWESATRTVYEFPDRTREGAGAPTTAYYQDATKTIPANPAMRKLPWWRRISYGAVMAGGVAGLVVGEISRLWK